MLSITYTSRLQLKTFFKIKQIDHKVKVIYLFLFSIQVNKPNGYSMNKDSWDRDTVVLVGNYRWKWVEDKWCWGKILTPDEIRECQGTYYNI